VATLRQFLQLTDTSQLLEEMENGVWDQLASEDDYVQGVEFIAKWVTGNHYCVLLLVVRAFVTGAEGPGFKTQLVLGIFQ